MGVGSASTEDYSGSPRRLGLSFDVTGAIAHNGSTIAHEGAELLIVTPDSRWAYAAELPLTGSTRGAGEVAVVVSVDCRHGAVGLALLHHDEMHLVAESKVADAGQTIVTLVADLHEVKSLVVRNVSSEGRSEAVITSLAISAELPKSFLPPSEPTFDVTRTIAHNGAIVSEEEPGLRVGTPDLQWAYAAEIPLAGPTQDVGEASVCVALDCERGAVGLALLHRDEPHFVAESQVAALDRSISLPVSNLHDVKSLVIRNFSNRGASEVVVRSISIGPKLDEPKKKPRIWRGAEPFDVAAFNEEYSRFLNAARTGGSTASKEAMTSTTSDLLDRLCKDNPPPERLFAVVSWGSAATKWVANALNDCPGIFCLHSANDYWRRAGASVLSGVDYLTLVGIQASAARVAGDVHGINRSDLSAIYEKFGDRFKAAVLVRDPIPRLHSQLAMFARQMNEPAWDVSYLEKSFPHVLAALPTGSYEERLFVHGANMVNAIIEEVEIGPIFRMKDVTKKPEALYALAEYLTAGAVDIPHAWAEQCVRMPPANRHMRNEAPEFSDWQRAVLREVIDSRAIELYRELDYDVNPLTA